MPLASMDSSRASSSACGDTTASDQLAVPLVTASLATSSFQPPGWSGAAGPGAKAAGAAATAGAGTDAEARSRLIRPDASRRTASCGAMSSIRENLATCSSGRTSSNASLSPSMASKSRAAPSAIFTPASSNPPLRRTTGLVVCSNATLISAARTACCRRTGTLLGM